VDAAWQRGSEGRGSGARRMDWDDEGGGGCGGGSGMGAVLRAMVLAMVRAKARRRRLNVGWRAMVDDGRRWSTMVEGRSRAEEDGSAQTTVWRVEGDGSEVARGVHNWA
jgi:hypothetical protein